MNPSRNDLSPRILSGLRQLRQPALTVLFVDPDTQGAERLARSLQGRNFVAVVNSAQTAVEAMALRMPDLIVTELDLPDASGLELLTRIYTTPATRNVLLMVVTRRNGVRDKIAAFQAGADDFLVKPVEPQDFLQHVQLLSRFRQVIPRN